MSMSNANLTTITNRFQDVRLISLATWRQAGEIVPRDRGGPYIVTQEGYDPEDMKVIANEFVLGHSGKWLSLGHFFQLPVPERRAEFVFGTAAEIMSMMSSLPSRPEFLRPGQKSESTASAVGQDEMADAYRASKKQSTPGTT